MVMGAAVGLIKAPVFMLLNYSQRHLLIAMYSMVSWRGLQGGQFPQLHNVVEVRPDVLRLDQIRRYFVVQTPLGATSPWQPCLGGASASAPDVPATARIERCRGLRHTLPPLSPLFFLLPRFKVLVPDVLTSAPMSWLGFPRIINPLPFLVTVVEISTFSFCFLELLLHIWTLLLA